MKTIIQQMIDYYHPQNNEDRKNAMKEVMQEIVLCSLSKANFFNEAAFYGGTALRIFYGLDRFSEDLDFSLLVKDKNFNLENYFPILRKTVQSFGLNVDIQIKEKTNESDIQSAFLKGNTIEHFLLFYPNDQIPVINKNDKIRIKFEIDTNPPTTATYETKYRLLPIPYSVQLYDESSLFAGKLHAVICRAWKNRVKGRDLYDYLFYLKRQTKFNLPLLKEKLIESQVISNEDDLTLNDVKELLISRFKAIDFKQAKEDVLPFIKDTTQLDIWSKEFFIGITEQLRDK